MKHIFYIFIIILIITSCDSNFLKNREVNIKYREKNPIESIKIDSTLGNIDIIGWENDFIEVNTKKILDSGLLQDINLMETIFEKNNLELIIKTKIPARIDGKINLKISVPFVLSKIYLNSKKGNINISKYLGDIELINKFGNINVLFQGNLLRINSYKSKLTLDIKTFNSSDIIVNNESGNSLINLENVGKCSFLDAKSVNGDLNIFISKNLDHKIVVNNNNKNTNLKYSLIKKVYTNGTNESIFGTKGKYFKDLIIYVNNDSGQVDLSLADDKYFKNEISKNPFLNIESRN